MSHERDRFAVEVRLLTDPCLWRWDIVDAAQGDLIESSWGSFWMGYDSSQEALRAGLGRLAELAPPGRGRRTP